MSAFDDALAGRFGTLLTRSESVLHHPQAEATIAIYETGDWFVAESHQHDPHVLAVKEKAKALRDAGAKGVPQLKAKPHLAQLRNMTYLYSGKRAEGTTDENSDEDIQRLFSRLIAAAHQRGATDIHIHIYQGAGLVDFRIHSIKVSAAPDFELTATTADRLANAIYNLNDGAGDGPQPDRFQSISVPRHKANLPAEIESLRVTYIPSSFGGKGRGRYIAIRLAKVDLYSDASTDLAALGYSPEHVAQLEQVLRNADGLTFIAGIMNSGKTKTLQVLINRLNELTNNEKRILTIEDPVELRIPNAVQVSIPQTKTPQERRDKYLEAASFDLRSDSNVTIYGEIRDPIVAEQAFDTVLRGNPTFATIHAKRATAILKRLKNWGIGTWLYSDPELVVGLVAQRLLPVLCQHCSKPLSVGALPPGLRERIAALSLDLSRARIREPRGCSRCAAGYTGRTLVAEVITPDETYMRHISNHDFEAADCHWLEGLKGRPMLHHALVKFASGLLDADDIETHIERIEPARANQLFAPRLLTAAAS